jgi:succinate dehydrogenase flavin-adding protein (antitoxin of CptAB toxin-antitoxin module)
MKELDVLLERYVHSHLAGAPSGQRRTLARLLELSDPQLADYLFGHAHAPDLELAELVEIIRATPLRVA